jgi:hypothetical protein
MVQQRKTKQDNQPVESDAKDIVLQIRSGKFSLTVGRAFATVLSSILTTILLAHLGSNAHIETAGVLGASITLVSLLRKVLGR